MGIISVVVPTFNESENVGNLTNQIDYALRGIDYEVIFVDDSTDDTPDAIRKVMGENPHVRMEHRETEKGLATAQKKAGRIAAEGIVATTVVDGGKKAAHPLLSATWCHSLQSMPQDLQVLPRHMLQRLIRQALSFSRKERCSRKEDKDWQSPPAS